MNTDNPNSLMNIGDLAKPANTLVEKISDAIGGIFKPAQIRRVAEAEADAEKIRILTQVEVEKIRALAQIEIDDLQRRAMARFFAEEAKKQENIESITRKALPEVEETARPDEINNDWITHFFDRSRLISDEDMQTLWARVLAGQANTPGSYSKRTIEILSNLETTDAEIFSTVCRFSVHGSPEELGDVLLPLIYDVTDDIYKNNGLNFASLAHLESLGLLHFKGGETGYAVTSVPQRPTLFYFNRRIPVELRYPEQNHFAVGEILLTHAGQELSSVCNIEPIDGFVDYLEEKWQTFRYKTGPDFEPDDPAVNQLPPSDG
jgi:hypothetical protein